MVRGRREERRSRDEGGGGEGGEDECAGGVAERGAAPGGEGAGGGVQTVPELTVLDAGRGAVVCQCAGGVTVTHRKPRRVCLVVPAQSYKGQAFPLLHLYCSKSNQA